MTRSLRVEFPGALYHVCARASGRRDQLFLDELDRKLFLLLLERAVNRYDFLCHAYCLMGTHYHLLLETARPNLSQGMRQLNSTYAQRANRRHRRRGHLFGGRYQAILVEREAHLLELARYVVLNPVRARICARPADWPWSSYRASAGLAAPPPFLSSAWLLAQFGSERGRAQRSFRDFVEAGTGCAPPEPRGIYLGSKAFITSQAPSARPHSEIPRRQWQPLRPPLSALLADRGKRGIVVAYREYGYRLHEIAAELGVHYATVSRALRRLEEEAAATDPTQRAMSDSARRV